MYCNSPLGELQHKAHIYMLAVAGANKSAGGLCGGGKERRGEEGSVVYVVECNRYCG